jgi:hypothetical protein
MWRSGAVNKYRKVVAAALLSYMLLEPSGSMVPGANER